MRVPFLAWLTALTPFAAVQGQTLYDLVVDAELKLAGYIDRAGLDGTLSDPMINYTVFAPNDGAFEDLPVRIQQYLDNTVPSDVLREIILNHVFESYITAADAIEANGTDITAINGDTSFVLISGDSVKLDESLVVQPDLLATNGIAHVVDRVIGIPDFRRILEAIPGVGDFVNDTLISAAFEFAGDLTLFFPDPTSLLALFAEFPLFVAELSETPEEWALHAVEIVLQHVAARVYMREDLTNFQLTMLSNQTITTTDINGDFTIKTDVPANSIPINVLAHDILTYDGVIHNVSALIRPLFFEETIMDVLRKTTPMLYDLVVLSGIDLSALGYSIFAPSDAALSAVDSATLDFLKSPEGKPELINLLTFHAVDLVIPLLSPLVLNGDTEYTTLQGGNITLTKDGPTLEDVPDLSNLPNFDEARALLAPTVTVEGKNVIQQDILAINGIVHVIDGVFDAPPIPVVPTASPVMSPTASAAPDSAWTKWASAASGIAAMLAAMVL